MVLVFLLFVAAVALPAAARFSVRPARSYRAWRVALVATELGQVWAVGALALAAVAGRMAAEAIGALRAEANAIATHGAGGGTLAVIAGLGVAATGLALVSAALFFRPAWSAWRMRRDVEARLRAVWGETENVEPLWSWRRLWRNPARMRRDPVRVERAGGVAVDFYPAAGAAPAAPCVVLVHGGGWDGGSRAELSGFDHWLAERGVAVLAFDYRLAPAHPWPAQREDLREVILWIRGNAARLGVDPERITLVGRSAGAQIAVATAYGEKLPGVRAVVALYGVHDLDYVWSIRSATDSLNSDRLMRQYLGGGPEDEARAGLYRSGSGERLVHADVPPTLIVHGALDEMVWCRHSERLAAALARVDAPHVFVRLPWATHACEANLHGPAGQLVTGAVLRVALGR